MEVSLIPSVNKGEVARSGLGLVGVRGLCMQARFW